MTTYIIDMSSNKGQEHGFIIESKTQHDAIAKAYRMSAKVFGRETCTRIDRIVKVNA